ncbi:hypothetical protein KIPB_011622, partial [Kipferlia bialata]|eukprot:g11622.t1
MASRLLQSSTLLGERERERERELDMARESEPEPERVTPTPLPVSGSRNTKPQSYRREVEREPVLPRGGERQGDTDAD